MPTANSMFSGFCSDCSTRVELASARKMMAAAETGSTFIWASIKAEIEFQRQIPLELLICVFYIFYIFDVTPFNGTAFDLGVGAIRTLRCNTKLDQHLYRYYQLSVMTMILDILDFLTRLLPTAAGIPQYRTSFRAHNSCNHHLAMEQVNIHNMSVSSSFAVWISFLLYGCTRNIGLTNRSFAMLHAWSTGDCCWRRHQTVKASPLSIFWICINDCKNHVLKTKKCWNVKSTRFLVKKSIQEIRR